MRIRHIGQPVIQVKTPGQLAVMREAGLVVARTLRVVADAVRPGITTAELDELAEREILAADATPSFKGYHGFPASICTSVNEEIVHGIPSPAKRLRPGDIISIDCGAIVDGWHADAALTVGVGEISAEHSRLLEVCESALWHGLAQARPGHRLTDISHAVELSVRSAGRYGIVEEYVGHGIGSAMHMEPAVPNYGRPGRGPRLTTGMALAVEPMVVLGGRHTDLLDDGWTVVSADRTWSAHFEHTVAITADGPWVTTAEDGGDACFTRFVESARMPMAGGVGGLSPRAGAAGGVGGLSPRAGAAGGVGGLSPQAGAAGGVGGSSPQASAARSKS